MKSYIKSNELLKRELEVSPLAAQTYSKSYRYFCGGNAPVYVDKAEGCYITDVDGNTFVDFMCALGPITVGYNDNRINQGVLQQLQRGVSFSLQHPIELFLAERLTKIIPCAEMVRFVKNGSDATTAAIKLARAYTDRDIVLMSGYHGMNDWSIGASENSRGVPKAVCELTKTFKYNDLEDLENKLIDNQGGVAAVILEPIQGDGPMKGYLEQVKYLTHKYGAILIFDEVVSGFRYALGGASELFGVTPDIAAFGKGMANGFPISVVAGRTDIMKLIEEGVFISTTFGGETLSMSAAMATLDILEEPGFYEHIWELGDSLKDGLESLIEKYKLKGVLSVTGLSPHCGLSFEGYGNLSYLDIQSIYSQEMIEEGILVFAICNFCSAHTNKEIEMYLDASDKAFAKIREAISKNTIDGMLIGKGVDPVFKRNSK